MKLLRSAFTAALFASGATALHSYRQDSNGPFTGENKDAQQIEEDGRITHRLTPGPAGDFDKYETLTDYSDEQFPRQTPHDQFVEYLFGTSETNEETSNFGRHRLGASYKNILTNKEPSVWLSQIYMGDTTPVDVMMDPSTRDSVIMKKSYNIENAVNSGQATLLEETKWKYYYDFEFHGDLYNDKVCVTLNGCVNMDFLLAKFSINNKPLPGSAGGVIGLARPNQSLFVARGADLPETQGSFLDKFSTVGTSFSTRLSRNVVSWIDFGDVDSQETASPGRGLWANKDYFWSLAMDSIQIGEDSSNNYAFSDESGQAEIVGSGTSIYTILDFNSPDILISKLWFSDLSSKLAKAAGVKVTYKSGIMTASCKKDWPDLYIDFGWGTQIKVNADDYVQDISSAGDRSKCRIHIKSINAPFNILGVPAFLEYYVTHDWETNNITFRPHSSSTKPPLVSGAKSATKYFSTPLETENVENGALWTFVIAITLTVALAALWGWITYRVFHKEMELDLWIVILIGIGGGGACAGLYFLWYWLFGLWLMPGNTFITVNDSEEALNIQVRSGHMGLLALFSYFIYKACGTNNDSEPKKEKKVESVTQIDELINSIE